MKPTRSECNAQLCERRRHVHVCGKGHGHAHPHLCRVARCRKAWGTSGRVQLTVK